jgi:hypothetical protein
MSAIGGKATCRFALHVSAFDPKRTLGCQKGRSTAMYRQSFSERAGRAYIFDAIAPTQRIKITAASGIQIWNVIPNAVNSRVKNWRYWST